MADEKKRKQAPTARQPSMAARYFANTIAANKSSNVDAARSYNRGDVGAAIGASSRKLLTVPNALWNDIVSRPIGTAAKGAASFAGGVGGFDPAYTPGGQPAADRDARIKQIAAATRAESNARVAAREDRLAAPVTPQERQLAYLDGVFKQPLTMKQFATFSGTLPAAGKPQSDKDAAYGLNAALSKQLYANQIAAAQEIGGDEGKLATAKAMEQYVQRSQAAIGIDAAKQALADSIRDAQED